MKKTAKELINQAEKLSGTQNSLAFDFAFKVSLLNSVYGQLYNELTSLSNSFVDYFEFTGKESALPDDCYKVLSVFLGSKDNPVNISSSGINNPIPGTFYIENDTIKIVGNNTNRVVVKYSKLPVILTCPNDPILFTIPSEYQSITSFYLKDDILYFNASVEGVTGNYAYNIMNETIEEIDTLPSYNQKFTLSFDDDVWTVIDWDNNDVTEYFKAESPFTGNEIYPEQIISDFYGTHTIIRYSDNSIWFMDYNYNKTYLNHKEYKGQFFYSNNIYAVDGNDETGFGFVYYDEREDKLAYGSFVPDTVLDYPNQAFFDIIEDMLGVQFQSLTGMSYEGLNTKLENDKTSFYSSIIRQSQGTRIRNEDNYYRRILW